MKSISCAVQKKRDCCISPDRHAALATSPHKQGSGYAVILSLPI